MFDLTVDEARLLLNIALMAIGANRFQSATKMLAVLERFRPDSSQVAVGKAVLMISAQQFDLCVDYVDNVALRRFPNCPMLLAFKGMALKRQGRDAEAAEPLQMASEQEADPAAAQLAKGLME